MDAPEQASERTTVGDDALAASESADAAMEMPATEPTPRLVRRVVCVYRSGVLPGEWLQTWRRLDRLLERSGLKVKALLTPLEDLDADVDVLVVPPDLREAAEAAVAPGVPVLVTTLATASIDFTELVRRLVEGTELTAERIDPLAPVGPTIVTYRGSTRLD
jgi:hypothetical protein